MPACFRLGRPFLIPLALGFAFAVATPALAQEPHTPSHILTAPQLPSVLVSVKMPDRPSVGARLFGQKACTRCHSLTASGPRIGPNLARTAVAANVLEVAGAFWNHAPVMRGKMREMSITPPMMTSNELADIIALLTLYRHDPTEHDQSGRPVAGRQVFIAKGCAACHDPDKAAAGTPGPNLERYRGSASAIFLVQAMWNHRWEMAAAMRERSVPWPRLTERDMLDLIAYLQAGRTRRGPELVYFEPGSPRRGRELFENKRCISCHTVAGSGGRGGPDLAERAKEMTGSVAALAASMWSHSQGMAAEFDRRGIGRPAFSGQEMADIIAYLYFVTFTNVRGVPALGQRVFAEKCGFCHTMKGARRVGPDLATAVELDDPLAIVAAMWNHAARMEEEMSRQRIPWPRFAKGEAADLAAYLVSARQAATVRR